MLYAKYQMTGADLFQLMQALPPSAQATFFSTVAGSGGGMNDLPSVVQNNMFGGNMTAYNQWINLWLAQQSVGNFDTVTGNWIDPLGGSGTLPGWFCPY
ncbi:MAG TPA: hypothetical protein VM120_21010 [Bryobacteraceae bacterium]|nr:hypothetical protein [Bryobacteraceae bacterium]